MAGHELTVEAYLAEVTALLPGPAAWHADVIAELRDGLYTDIEASVSSGVPPGPAAALALHRFGPPRTVAAGFADEAAAVRARRIAGRLLATGPVAAGAWLAALATSDAFPALARLDGPWRFMPVVGVVLGIVVPSALFAAGLTGRSPALFPARLRLWLAGRSDAPVRATCAAAGCCAAGDALMLAMFTYWAVTRPAAVLWPVAALALAVSSTRCAVLVGATRRLRASPA
jgi:hypothetical protein